MWLIKVTCGDPKALKATKGQFILKKPSKNGF